MSAFTFQLTPAVQAYAARRFGVKTEDSTPSSKHQGLTVGEVKTIKACALALSQGKISRRNLAALCGSKEATMSGAKVNGGGVRPVDAAGRYSSKRASAVHTKTGKPVARWSGGPQVEGTSELDKARCGAWLKLLARNARVSDRIVLSDHEKSLLYESGTERLDVAKGQGWIEMPNAGQWTESSPARVKALLDDGFSGGSGVNPIWFDQNVISFPLLSGEIFPNVDLIDVPRGRIINTASVGNPTVTWGTPEGTAVTLFNTSNLVQAITATVFPVMVAIEIGRDLLADAEPVDLYNTVVMNIGARLMAELDKVCCVGDGVTQPQGLLNSSASIAVNSDNGLSGPPTVSDAETLMFSLGKQYRQAPFNPCFVGSDQTYRRFRSMPVGPSDQRRVMGMDEEEYKVLGHDFKVNNSMPNNKAAFLPLSRYRMYRRMGFETQFSIEGNSLMQKNTALLVCRGRFAGKIIDGNAVVVMGDLQP